MKEQFWFTLILAYLELVDSEILLVPEGLQGLLQNVDCKKTYAWISNALALSRLVF